ncbi:MAG: lytic transglycosylase domain-containing protein [Desulfocapsaceae bacterium]|nr:lytic transglycosylase domain-containing protein [Desulfocapsaceae bacterium]
MRKLPVFLFVLLWFSPGFAEIVPLNPMFQEAAETWGIPADLTRAIARVESGLSPWAINIEGQGYTFDSKEKAVQKALEAQAAGLSFDSGVMQVNNAWLSKFGIPLEAAFDPLANIYLGSWILKQEIKRHGPSWKAVGAYHSPDPGKGRRYAEMVRKALDQGPVKKAGPDQQTVKKPDERRQADYAPLVVLRRDRPAISNQIDQPEKLESFVKRPIRSE